jgi:hypothetical protein
METPAHIKEVAETVMKNLLPAKSTFNIKDNINIGTYSKLIAFLKRKKDGYLPKKSKEEIEKFIINTPDEDYLLIIIIIY